MKRLSIFMVVMVALALMVGAAFGASVKIMSSEGMGDYLTDSGGMTLYYFKNDSPEKSVCYGGCAKNWPAFYAEKIEVPEGLDAEDFGTITRDDGKQQTTFRGYPLYYFSGDRKAGDTSGEGIGGVWYVVNPDKFMKKM